MSLATQFFFETFTLDISKRELRRDGEQVALEPQVFDLLAYVIRNRDRVVSKDDLVEAVWGGRIVSDSTLTTRINAMRKALGDSGEEQRLIRTVARKGIRFVGVVTEGQPAAAPVEPIPPERPPLPLPDKPSIAVLPFQNISDDPAQEYFCDGMVEEIITALSRFHWLFVIARNSSFTYKGRAVDVKQVARELGVRYVVEGSVRKAGQAIRITGQLIDASTGAHLWAEKFDGDLADVFELQDKVAVSVVGAIEPRLREAEFERTNRKPTGSLDAYDHVLRAYNFMQTLTREGNDLALKSLGQALAADETFSTAAGLSAWCRLFRRAQGWVTDFEAEASEVRRLAHIVADNSRSDAVALAYAALPLAYVSREHDTAVSLIDRALAQNTNAFAVWNANGWIRLYIHEPEQALSSLQRAYRLNPLDPVIHLVMHGLATAHWFLNEFDESIRWARLSVSQCPQGRVYHTLLIQALVSANNLDEARTAARNVLRLWPNFSIRSYPSPLPYRNPEVLTARLAAMRAAGIPE